MSLEFFGHPFSSYTQKVLIALWADETPFDYRMIDRTIRRIWRSSSGTRRSGMFPLLLDDGAAGVRNDLDIIEHLQAHHPRPERLDSRTARRTAGPLPRPLLRPLRHEQHAEAGRRHASARRARATPTASSKARERPAHRLRLARGESRRRPVGGRRAASPWPTAPRRRPCSTPTGSRRSARAGRRLAAYRARLLAHPVVARAVDEGRPFRAYFPLGAPDRD